MKKVKFYYSFYQMIDLLVVALISLYLIFQHRDTPQNKMDDVFEFTPENMKVS